MNSKKTRACTITAHLPMLRIEPERLSFHDFDLWRMPFEVYNDLTGGNQDSLKTDYLAVAPVFLQFRADAEVPDEPESGQPEATGQGEAAEEQDAEAGGGRVIELRSQDSAYQSLGLLGLGSAAAQIRGIWSLISLTFPFLLLPEPGLSQIFVHVDNGEIGLSNVRGSRACVQGPADYEYFFLDIPRQRTLKVEDFPPLLDTFKLAGALYGDAALKFAFESFLESLSPVFGWAERTTLCVIALESLLMPETWENLTETFARRLPKLLLGEESGVPVDEPLARRLYAARSDELHGTAPNVPGSPTDLAMAATCALGAVVRKAAKLVQTGSTIDEIRLALDAAPSVDGPRPQQSPAGRTEEAGANRLFVRQRVTAILMGQDTLIAAEGEAACWCPLAGLEAREWVPFGRSRHPILIAPLNGNEILSLEDKETRADYAGQLRLIEERVAGFFIPISGHIPGSGDLNPGDLTPGDVNLGDPQQLDAALQSGCRLRDFGTIALRIAGFEDFWDPEWHGAAMFIGSVRVRRPTVFRQSVLSSIRRSVVLADHDNTPVPAITHAHESILNPIWDMLSPYVEACPAQIQRSLNLFRRACDPAFLSDAQRLRLAFAAFESMLGRFARRSHGVSAEDIVVRLVRDRQPEAAEWFSKNGRQDRNAVAHNSHPDSDVDRHLAWSLAILRAVVPACLTAWVDPDLDQFATPSRKLAEWVLRR